MQALLTFLQQEMPDGLRFLEQMVNMDSPSTDKVLVDRFVRFVGSRFESIGGIAEYIPDQQFGDHLRVTFQGKRSNRVLLLGHTDTVFPVGEAARRPFQIANGNAR